jgi:carbamoyltransferase
MSDMSIKSPTNLELSKKQNKVKIVGFHSGHDTSYCILENGVPIIHEEKERISRIKMDEGDGLSFFFSRYKQDDIKYFTFGSWGARDGTNKEICFSHEADDRMRKIALLNEGAYFEFGHHTCHAANSFYTSNFEEALIIVVDGGGREAGNIRTGLTIHEGKKNKINKIKVFDLREINLGGLYFKATKYIFGLSVRAPNGDQAGTVMAMATFGKPKYQEMFLDFNKNWSALRSISRSSEQERFNVAASLQAFIEKKFHSYISNFINKSDHENLCLGGGVALNCVMMGKIKKWFPQIKNIYIDPVPYDAGLSLGAARYLWHNILGNPRIDSIQNMSPYLGRIYSEAEVKKALASFSDSIKFKKTSSNEVLDKIANQKIVSIFGGRSESGRRALGNRSIIADPRSEKIKAVINEKVKHRQWFRPLSPAILEEEMSKWFEDPIFNPYMSFAVKFKKEVKSKIPAVVHYDGTGRFQTVNSKLNPWFHNFLTKWAKMTGIPILINTSFNDREPIVESPEDAIKCFLKTEIDYLYFYDYGYLVENINT